MLSLAVSQLLSGGCQITKLARRLTQWVSASIPKKRECFECSIAEITFKYESEHGDALYSLAKNRVLDSFEFGSLLYWYRKSKESALVLDVGAYTGIYSLVAAKLGSTVMSIEPNFHIFGNLIKNLSINNLSTGNAYNFALGSEEKSGNLMAPKLKFHRNPQLKGSGIQLETAETERNLNSWRTIGEIRIRTLDQLVTANDYLKIGIVKIDAEGSEYAILNGAKNLLHGSASEFLIECLTTDSLNKTNSFMLKFGYYMQQVFGKNYLFVKR